MVEVSKVLAFNPFQVQRYGKTRNKGKKIE